MRTDIRPLCLALVLALLLLTSPGAQADWTAIDGALQQQDQAVLGYFTRNFVRDHRNDKIFQHIFSRLGPHLGEVFSDPEKEVTPYVFVSNLGFNAMTWDHIIVFDSLLTDTFHRIADAHTLYGTTDNPYFWNLARQVASLQMRATDLPQIADTHSPGNLYHLPVAGTLNKAEQLQSDALFEEMLASWLGHEASHAFLNHARLRMQSQSMREWYGMQGNGNALGNYMQNASMFTDNGLDREKEADESGAALITRSGYSLKGFVVSLEFAERLEELTGANTTYLRSHPPARERITDIERVTGAESVR